MSFGRRSQANIISAVLITAILLAAVIGTYIWAQPIMVKAYDKRRIDYAKDMLSSIKQAIEDSAFQQGQKVIPVEFDKGSQRTEILMNMLLIMKYRQMFPCWHPLDGLQLMEMSYQSRKIQDIQEAGVL